MSVLLTTVSTTSRRQDQLPQENTTLALVIDNEDDDNRGGNAVRFSDFISQIDTRLASLLRLRSLSTTTVAPDRGGNDGDDDDDNVGDDDDDDDGDVVTVRVVEHSETHTEQILVVRSEAPMLDDGDVGMRRAIRESIGTFARESAARRDKLDKQTFQRVVQTRRAGCADRRTQPQCVICLDAIRFHKVAQLPCGHIFHVRCCHTWATKHSNTCPVCRTAVYLK